MANKFDRILDECIDLINNCEGIEACLARYPDHFADVKAGTIEQALGSLSIEPGDKVTIKEDENGEVKEFEVENAEVDGLLMLAGLAAFLFFQQTR